MTNNDDDEDGVYIPEASPGVTLYYDGCNWDTPIEEFYREHPEARGKLWLLLLQRGGIFDKERVN